jgi:hypothetical protein
MTELDTLPDGTYTAVVDRIEDGLATVFVVRGTEELASATLEAAAVPEAGRHADAILSVRVSQGEIVEWTYEPDATETRQSAAQERFDRLSRRPPSADDSSDADDTE